MNTLSRRSLIARCAAVTAVVLAIIGGFQFRRFEALGQARLHLERAVVAYQRSQNLTVNLPTIVVGRYSPEQQRAWDEYIAAKRAGLQEAKAEIAQVNEGALDEVRPGLGEAFGTFRQGVSKCLEGLSTKDPKESTRLTSGGSDDCLRFYTWCWGRKIQVSGLPSPQA